MSIAAEELQEKVALLRSLDGGVWRTVSKPREIVPTNFNVETVLEAMAR